MLFREGVFIVGHSREQNLARRRPHAEPVMSVPIPSLARSLGDDVETITLVPSASASFTFQLN